MSAALLKELERRGVELWFEGERVRFRAPKGALTNELRSELGARRAEVLARLRTDAAARVRTFPLSYSQRSLWFVNQENPESAAYNVGFAARVVSAIDVAALRQALQALVDRHAALRTGYPVVDGLPVQSVVGTASAVLELHQVEAIDEAELRNRVEADYRRPFDLAAGQVFRTALHSRSPTDHVLLINVHHIAADGWSFLQLLDELRALYAESTGGPPASAARPDAEYTDFTRWQAETLAGAEGKRLADYWRRQLAAPRAEIELPADRRRPARRSSNGATYAFELEAELSEALRKLARGEATTLFVVLLAAFKTLLFRHTGTEDVIVGTPTFGRNRPEFARVIGDFVNTIALRSQLDSGLPFRELLLRLRQTVLDALDAQDFPFPLVVEQLQPVRDPSRSPLFEILFVLQRFDQLRELAPVLVPGASASIDFGGLRLQQYTLDQQEGQFDLTMQAVDRSGALAVQLKYNVDLFDETTIARLAGHLRSLLKGIVADPAQPLGQLPLLTPDERRALDLIEKLGSLGIRIAIHEGRLRVNAPKGVLDDALKAELARNKEAILAHLRTREEADARASGERRLARVDRSGDLPLSHPQQRLWFLKQMDPGNMAYQLPCAFRMEGVLDETALERSLADLVQRHESLRTRFIAVDGTPRCVIEPTVTLPFERVDLGALPPAEREDAAAEALRQFIFRPFDIARAPLMRATLIRLASRTHVFCFVQDHIVSDGISVGILLLELRALYTQHVGGPAANMVPLPVQYVDIADWQRRAYEGGTLTRHLDYWKRQLAGPPPALQLPTDRPRPPVQTYRGARLIRNFPNTLVAQAHATARNEGATQFMVLLAAFQVLLHRYCGVADIPVGTAVGNRGHASAEAVVGFFASNIVLRGDLSGRPTVRELLARVRETCLQGMSHQEMPFDMLVEALGTRRDIDHAPLFQVMFVLHNVSMQRLELPQLECDWIEFGSDTARFDLSVDVFPMADGMRVSFEYNTDLFDEGIIDQMVGHYRRLLEGFVAHPEARISALPLLSESEQRQLLVEWNATVMPYAAEQTVHGLFEARVAHAPDAVAARFEGTQLSYGELNARANQLAHHLRALGVGRESLVSVWMERSVEMIVALLGILKAGGAYVPLDPAFPKDRIDFMMEDAALGVVVTQTQLAESLGAGGPRPVLLDGDAAALAKLPVDNLAPVGGAQNLAYVIYTSGSTGRPKGVQLEHRAVVNFLLSMHRVPGIGAQDRFVAVTTLSFDIAGLEILGPLTAGGTVVLASRAMALDGVRLAELLDSSNATILQATPATWRLLLETGWRGRPKLKMLCGGEALPRDLAGKLLALGGELWNLYGPTETTIWSTLSRVTDTSRAIPIGRPIANTQVYVLEPSGLPAPIGVHGELCIGGDGLARGYRNRDDLTAEKFVTLDLPEVGRTRVYRTGDVARFLADGQLEFAGRRDHQVKVRGFRIELGEIEAVLATHAGVKECVVHVREDTPGDQRLVGYVVPATGESFDADSARATLRAKLPEYMVPNLFVTLEAFPLTPNGKIDRKALPAPRVQAVASAAISDAVMTPVQRQVAAIWRQVLGIERVGLDANFFDIGGHSLLLVKLQAALQREFGRDLPLVELFQRTTVAAQAERLGAPQASDTALKRAQARAAKQHHE